MPVYVLNFCDEIAKCAYSESVLTLYEQMNGFFLFLMLVALFACELQFVLYLECVAKFLLGVFILGRLGLIPHRAGPVQVGRVCR